MSTGMPMYFLWRLNVSHALGWRSPRMGKISCYVIRLTSASIDRGITFWAVDMHICMVILDPSWCGDHKEPTGQTATGGWMIRDVLMVLMVGMQIEVESEDRSWFKGQNGALEAECEWWCDKEKYGSWQYPPSRCRTHATQHWCDESAKRGAQHCLRRLKSHVTKTWLHSKLSSTSSSCKTRFALSFATSPRRTC